MIVVVVAQAKEKFSKASVERTCKRLFKIFKNNKVVKLKKAQSKEFADLVVAFVDKKTSKKLNTKYRKKKYPTDVLSFQTEQNKQGLGELVLCLAVLKKQAQEQKHSLNKEVLTMLIHGFLHLLGYDHEKSLKESQRMMKIQDRIIKQFLE